MRGLVLLLLGGGLVWWIWSGLGSSENDGGTRRDFGDEATSVVEAAAPPPGRMLAPPPSRQPQRPQEDAQAAGRPAQQPERAAQRAPARPESEAAIEARQPLGARPAPREARSDSPGRAPLNTPSGMENTLAIADCLLHRPHGLPEVLAAQGDAVSPDRERLLLAYAHAIDGRFGKAHELASGLETSRDISSAEWDLCRALVAEDSAVRPVSASAGAQGPIVLAATMAWNAREADRWLKAGDFKQAAWTFSELLQEELVAPWPADRATLERWIEGLSRAQAMHRWNRDGDWPSFEVTVQAGESLVAIRKRVLRERPELLLCTGLIARANELRGSVIHPGDRLRIPTERAHALVDLDSRVAFYMHGNEVVGAWIVGIGRPGDDTRPGSYVIGDKQENPMWFRPGQDPVPFGDPANPLGTRWLGWEQGDGKESTLGFHGTNDPDGVGGAVSDGCIRMHNVHVEELFDILPKGAEVFVRP